MSTARSAICRASSHAAMRRSDMLDAQCTAMHDHWLILDQVLTAYVHGADSWFLRGELELAQRRTSRTLAMAGLTDGLTGCPTDGISTWVTSFRREWSALAPARPRADRTLIIDATIQNLQRRHGHQSVESSSRSSAKRCRPASGRPDLARAMAAMNSPLLLPGHDDRSAAQVPIRFRERHQRAAANLPGPRRENQHRAWRASFRSAPRSGPLCCGVAD